MFRRCGNSRIQTIFLGAALLVYPWAMSAQHGGGGGHVGGTAAGGGGLSGGNHASGVDAKDDLRSFHEVLAVQASREQQAAYAAMLKSTVAANTELQDFVTLLTKGNNAPETASRDKSLEDAIETARTLNKRFLEGFSEAQKTGLKEITKRLTKADSEVAQQAKGVDQAVEANAASSLMVNSAQNLEHTLADFQRAQIGLGEEMSIATAANPQNLTFNLTPVKSSIGFADQAVAIVTSGVVSKSASEDVQNTFAVELTADMSDLQHNIADFLRVQLNKSDRCGERIAIQTADLTPQGPAGVVVVQLHFERWTCPKMFGKESMNEVVEGNGTMEVKLTPAVAEDGTLRLVAQPGRITAEALLSEMLRSGSLGEALREKIADSILAIMRQGSDFKATLPAGARGYATLQRAQFQGTGAGKLMAVFDGEIRVSNDQVTALTGELGRASQEQSVPGPLLPRPTAPQEAVSH